MAGFSREFLGTVEIKGGVVAIGQPGEYVSTTDAEAVFSNNYLALEKLVLVATEFQDGIYTVYGTIGDEGRITSVEIDLTDVSDRID